MSDLNVASSPRKLNKCKRFLTMLLSPSTPKRPFRRKKFASSRSKSFDDEKPQCKENDERTEGNFQMEDKVSDLRDLNLPHDEPCSSLSPIQSIEPLYATVQKKIKGQGPISPAKLENNSIPKTIISAEIAQLPEREEIIDYPNSSSSLSSLFEQVDNHEEGCIGITAEGSQPKAASRTIKKFQRQIKVMSSKNQELSKQILSLKREAKWKKEMEHSKFRSEITKLETNTKNEVTLLCDRIKALDEERKLLSNHVQNLHEEKQSLQKKYAEVCREKESMVSLEKLQKVLDQQKKSFTDDKMEHLKEIKRLEHLNKTCSNEKKSLTIQLEILQSEINSLRHQNQELEQQQKTILHNKNQLIKENEEFRKQENEAQQLLTSLLRVTESIEMERDLLLSKSTFQDHLHGEIQTTLVDYGLNIGRLQEHLLSIKKNFDELENTKVKIHNNDENVKHIYEKQVDILRGKVINQNNTIKELETEKSELICRLENLWKTAYDNPRTYDFQKELSFITI